ncbi:MAG: Uma2 family endonuclease, partial [Vulcanimicrobiaceae bacterium]
MIGLCVEHAMATQAPLVYEDLASFPEDNVRREILGGELYVTPSPSTRHQKISFRLGRLFEDYVEQAGGDFYLALDSVLSAQNVVEPDVLYIAPDRMHT